MSDPLEVAKKAQKDAEANLKLSVDLLKDARKANDEAALALQDILQEGGADPNRTRHSQKYYDDEWRDRMATCQFSFLPFPLLPLHDDTLFACLDIEKGKEYGSGKIEAKRLLIFQN